MAAEDKKTKLILFDWGNIVESHTTGYSCYNAFDDAFYECGYRGEEKVFYILGKYNIACIRNEQEFEKTYELMKQDFNLNKTYQEFVDIYKKTFAKIDYYKDVAEYEVSLKDKCYIGILSDLTLFDKERLDHQVHLENYDYVFLSFEMGLKKPNVELFKLVQSKLQFKTKDILFIDDRKVNVEAALAFGWNAFQATGLELDKIKDKCEEFLNED